MASITIKPVEDKDEWESFLAQRAEANFLQSWYWGEFHTRLGKKVQRIGFYESGKIIGVALSIVEDARRGRYLTLPGGPIIDWKNRKLAKVFFEEIRRVAKKNNCVFVRIRPQLVEDMFSKEIFKKYKSVNAPMHLTADLTHQLDLSKTEEELLAGMRKATRYEIRKAEKIGVKVSSTNEEKEIKKFYDLQLETAIRQKFVPFSYKFFHEQFKVFFEQDLALIYTASFEDKILAQAFVIFYGSEAVYHYGVGTEEGRRYPGAYLIQWEAIKEAKRRKMKKYNFWGVAPLDAKNHRFAGVSLFKRGFGGEDVQYFHAQDLIVNNLKYIINFLVEIIRKKVRGLG